MPWREMSIMDQRMEFVLLARLPGANVSELCRRIGISRQTGYKWLRRAGDEVQDLRAAMRDRSRRPHVSPGRTSAAQEQRVLAVRDAHPAWGARKIARRLQDQGESTPAPSSVHAILARHGRIEPPAGGAPAHGRFEQPAPNLLWQMDFKGRFALGDGTNCHPLTVVDDHSRYALCIEACTNERTATVRPLLERTFRLFGLPAGLYVDNGSPWGGGTPGHWTPLGVWLLKLGVRVIHARPYHPQGRGKNERFHRTLKAEVLALTALRDCAQAQAAFDSWRPLYNAVRPHQGLGLATPASRYHPSPRRFPDRLQEPHYEAGEIERRVSTSGCCVSFNGRLWKLPKAFRGEPVALRP
ncbi:IS481 family transposase, partial [Rhodobium orientis]